MIRRFMMCIGLLIATPVFAETPAAMDLKQHLEAFSTMKANFNHVLTDSSDKIIQQSSGSMVLKRPGFFRWYTHQPNRQIIVVGHEKISIYDLDLAQLTINPLNAEEDGAIPAAALLNPHKGSFDRWYHVTQKRNTSKKTICFTLTPKSPDDPFSWVKFFFRDHQLIEMDFKDKMNQISKITFSHIVFNKKINEGIFTVKPTKETDIIDNTRIAIRN